MVRTLTEFDNWRDINYMEGHEFESLCADMLKKIGYTNVRVTPGSGDNGVDILAYDPKKVLTAVQCKRYTGNVGNQAVQAVYSGGDYYGARRYVVITNSDFTKAAKEQADGLRVELWNRDELYRLLSIAYPKSSYAKIHKKIQRQQFWDAFSSSNKKSSGGSGCGCLIWIIIIVAVISYCANANKDYSPYPVSSQSREQTNTVYYLEITDDVNLREAMGVDEKVLLVVPKGTRVFYAEKMAAPNGDVWYKISYKGQSGWVYGEYTRVITS